MDVSPPPPRALSPPPAGTEPPVKRRRLGPGAHGSLLERKMQDLEVSLEVDHLILDYLLYKATEACFNHPHSSWDEQVSPVERSLLQVDEFYALFRKRYPTYKLDAEIRFRQVLLQLVALFTQRMRRNSTTLGSESLERLRETNRRRALRWIGCESRLPSALFDVDIDSFDDQMPVLQADLERNRVHVLRELGLPAEEDAYEDSFYGTRECVSLLDILPLFMKVSGTCMRILDVDFNDQWTQMATELILQVCLEQYLVFGATGTDAIDEAFAWDEEEIREQDSTDAAVDKESMHVNTMHEDGVAGAGVSLWRNAMESTLQRVTLQGQRELADHLMDLATQYPISRLDASISSYLQGLSMLAPPVLLQLEQGQLAGMTKDETRAFITDCGLDVASFYIGEDAS